MSKKITVATCQHSLSADIRKNLENIRNQVKIASKRGADIAHFPECNLSGYAGIEFEKYKEHGNDDIKRAVEDIQELARVSNISIIFGSHWFLRPDKKPVNSLFLVDNSGDITCRYDKRLLTAGDSGDDIKYYSKGESAVVFVFKGIRCGLLICHEWRYPELYREYKSLGVDLIFQSWYDAGVESKEYYRSGRDHGSLITGSVRSMAANNYMWISASNASNRETSFGSFLVRPDGRVVDKLPRNKPGVLISEIDCSKQFTDPSKHNRELFL